MKVWGVRVYHRLGTCINSVFERAIETAPVGYRHLNHICTMTYKLTKSCDHATATCLVHTTVEESIGIVT